MNGVPWDIATSMPDEVRMGWSVAVGNMNSGDKNQFDWGSMSWPE